MHKKQQGEKLDDLGWKFVRSVEWKHNGRLVERGHRSVDCKAGSHEVPGACHEHGFGCGVG
jgi:hypothetical protein